MADLPDPLARVELLLGASTIAHEAVFDLHTELVGLGRDTDRTRELLAESVSDRHVGRTLDRRSGSPAQRRMAREIAIEAK